MTTNTPSPVIQLLDLTYKHALAAAPRSWQRINYAMGRALGMAIGALFEFAINDFTLIFTNYKSGYWAGDDLERWYSQCVADGNMSAILSYENYARRGPLIADGVTQVTSHYAHVSGSRAKERLHVGATFHWKGHRVTVTSMSSDLEASCTACAYERRDGRDGKVIKRFKISRDCIIAERADRKRRKEIEDEMTNAPDDQRQKFMVLIGNPKRDEFAQLPLKKLEAALKKVVQ